MFSKENLLFQMCSDTTYIHTIPRVEVRKNNENVD